MKKFTLSLALVAAFATANADEKIIFQDNFNSDNWTESRGNNIRSIQKTSDGNYIQLGDGKTSYNGTRYNEFWGSTPWDGVELPASGYTMSFMFNFEQFGNNSSNAAQRNNEIAVWNAIAADNLSLGNYWGTTTEVMQANAESETPVEGSGYLFKLTHCLSGTAAGEGGYATAPTGTCFFRVNNEKDSINVAASTWYKVTLNVVGQEVSYSIEDISGSPLTSGTYTLADGVDNQAGGLIHYQARYLGITNFMDVKIAYDFDGDVAADPTVILTGVQRENRVYKMTFNEGEFLHFVAPGAEEVVVDYWDAEDPVTGDPGVYTLVVSTSGTLQAWTTKNDAKSNVIETEVEAGVITLPDPIVAIASVSEGYGKLFSVSIDNASVLLSPTVALTYVINYADGTKAEGEVSNGGTVAIEKAGTMVVTANTIPVAGVEYYDRSSVTVNNDVEYVCALDVEYHQWNDARYADQPTYKDISKNAAFEASTLVDTNTSHWIGKWMNEHPKGYGEEGVADWWKAPSFVTTEGDTPLPIYTLINDEEGVNYATELLPIIPNTARANIAILVEEGMFVNGTGYNNLEIKFDPSWITDDPAKPNFVELKKVGGYDRYDKQPAQTVTIVKTDDESQLLYRFDTAINSARIFAYKGFSPTSISSVATSATKLDNAIYTLSGVRVANAAVKGIYIQNGKKFIVK